MIGRISANFALLALVIFLPAWAAMLAGTAFAFAFPWYGELVFAGIILDMILGAPVPALRGFGHFYFASGAIVFLIAAVSRSTLHFYHRHE